METGQKKPMKRQKSKNRNRENSPIFSFVYTKTKKINKSYIKYYKLVKKILIVIIGLCRYLYITTHSTEKILPKKTFIPSIIIYSYNLNSIYNTKIEATPIPAQSRVYSKKKRLNQKNLQFFCAHLISKYRFEYYIIQGAILDMQTHLSITFFPKRKKITTRGNNKAVEHEKKSKKSSECSKKKFGSKKPRETNRKIIHQKKKS